MYSFGFIKEDIKQMVRICPICIQNVACKFFIKTFTLTGILKFKFYEYLVFFYLTNEELYR